mmetsp:Transcript_18999/g.48996  ORF Transcript_18999/g.48996 Transcript_18999/m.48996 type:complete len:240 (+) Transcript_18999:405-1124(+)
MAVAKKRSPLAVYRLAPSGRITSSTTSCCDVSHAYLIAASTTPPNTAYTRFVTTVVTVTNAMMNASYRSAPSGKRKGPTEALWRWSSEGTNAESMYATEPHLKVCTTTTTITPASADTGIRLRSGYALTMHTMTPTAVVIGAMRPVPPFSPLIVERPIIALPPMPPSMPDSTLASPIEDTTAAESAGVLTSSVTTSVVRSDSITPTAHSMKPCCTMMPSACGFHSTPMSYWLSRKKGVG